MKSFSVLQTELEDARSTLKTFDNDIKRLIGRDPSELPTRPPQKRNNFGPAEKRNNFPQSEKRNNFAQIDKRNNFSQIEKRNNFSQVEKRSNFTQADERSRPRSFTQNDEKRFKNSRLRMVVQENEEPPVKKRNTGVSVFKRLSERPVQDEFQSKQMKGMISKVIVTPKEIPSRQERMEAQSKDQIVVARNRRMFGSLLGTLQKFQQEQTKLKTKEDKRAQLEKKIEEHEIKEKEEIKKERQELFLNRKRKQAEIKMIELKMIRMKEYTAWEEAQKRRMNFIHTKTKPQIHYLPRKLKDVHKEILENTKTEIQSIIDKKREQVEIELGLIEERGRRIFEPRKFQDNKEQEDNEDENCVEDDELKHLEDDSMDNVDRTDNTVEAMENEDVGEVQNGIKQNGGDSGIVDESEVITCQLDSSKIKEEKENSSIENVQQGEVTSSVSSGQLEHLDGNSSSTKE